jgi:hypothetical protein
LGITGRAGTAYSSGAHAFFLWPLYYLSWIFMLIYSSFYHILNTLSKCMNNFYKHIAYNWSFTRVTRRVSLVEQQLPTLKEHMGSPRDYWDSCCSYATIALVLQIILCPFCIFLTAFVLSVLQLTASYYLIGFFELSLITILTL